MARTWLGIVGLGIGLLTGCATGSTGRSGPEDDGGSLDAGPTTDSGEPSTDSGEDDGGPVLRTDSGSGEDAGGEDAGPCTGPADCDDGLACNGAEQCVDGSCRSGTPVTCDDGVACTVDSCTEPDGECESTPDDTACGTGESCDPSTGCISGCSESPCKLVAPQCGCAGGQACYLSGDGSRICAEPGTATAGEACGPPSCEGGLICTSLDDAGEVGGCLRFCNGDADCPGDGSLCILTFNDSGGSEIPDVTACTTGCDPVAQTGCPDDAHCFVGREQEGAMRFLTHCAGPNGTGTTGACCADDSDCQKGFACIDPDGSTGSAPSQCMKWCRRPTGASCPGGTSCVGFDPGFVIGTTEYGVCGPTDTSTCTAS